MPKKPTVRRRSAKLPRATSQRQVRKPTAPRRRSTSTPVPVRKGIGRGAPNRPRKSLRSQSKTPGNKLELARKSADNMLGVLGGRERVVELLADSHHPKAQQLIDRLRCKQYIGENFATSYTSVGLKAPDIVEIFGDVQQAKTFITALSELSEVMRSLIRAAKDQIEPHEKCDGSGWKLDTKGKTTTVKCKPCRGSGYILKSGARDAQELYFTLLKMKQSGMQLNIDARKQQINSGTFIAGVPAGQAPDVHQIIKTADQVRSLPPPSMAAVNTETVMPDDRTVAVEAEVV